MRPGGDAFDLNVIRKLNACRFEPRRELGSHARGLNLSQYFSICVQAAFEIAEDILQYDHIPLHTLDLGNLHNFARAIPQACLLHDQIDGRLFAR